MQDTLDKRVDDGIADALTSLKSENAATEARLNAQIQATSTQDRETTSQLIGTRIDATTVAFNSTLDTRLGDLSVSVTKEAVDGTRALLDQRLAEVPAQVRTQVDSAVSGLRESLSADLTESVTANFTGQIKDVDTR